MERMKRRFAEMVNDSEHTTLYEGWGIGPNGFPGGTTNHAWSGGGLTILSQYVCGITPTEAGYKAYRIAPQPTGVKEAEILVPTVKGNIKVSFKDDERTFQLQVNSPQGPRATICLPFQCKSITLNNKLIWKNGKDISHKSSIVKCIHQDKDESIFITMKEGGNWTFNINK
jgi:alpha-L-rhamnosidase